MSQTPTNWQQAVEEKLEMLFENGANAQFRHGQIGGAAEFDAKKKQDIRSALQAIAKATGEHVIGRNDKPNTWVQKYPGSISPGIKKSTKLSENEKSRNTLRAEQRTELGISGE